MRFVKESDFPVPAETLWAFHERPDAFARLMPPWQRFEVEQPPTSLEVGTVVKLRVRVGPLWQRIVAEHVEYDRARRLFADRMVKGPFASWLHRHVITETGPGTSRLTDEIDYELPLGALGRTFGSAIARHQLERLFAYRHAVTLAACLEAAR
jgi:ligand-binding SRPBCC domain-containing protein